MLRVGLACVALPCTVSQFGCMLDHDESSGTSNGSPSDSSAEPITESNSMKIQYLEIVTPEVDAVCETYSRLHDVTFSEADQNLGGARVAKLADGGMLGVRAPMRDSEHPIVRHYILVEDIQAAVDAAEKSGAVVALPPMQLAGHGTCAIVIQGGIEAGFWQL